MRKAVIAVFATAAFVLTGSPAQGCGDKLLLVGRTVKFKKAYASVNPGHVLIFARPSTSAKAAIRDPQFQRLLRQAGHAVSVIEDARLLEQALKSVQIDIVLADVAEAPQLEPLTAASPSRPEAVYVEFPPKVARSAAAQYACKLKSTDSPLKYLDELDNTMKARAAARRAGKGH